MTIPTLKRATCVINKHNSTRSQHYFKTKLFLAATIEVVATKRTVKRPSDDTPVTRGRIVAGNPGSAHSQAVGENVWTTHPSIENI